MGRSLPLSQLPVHPLPFTRPFPKAHTEAVSSGEILGAVGGSMGRDGPSSGTASVSFIPDPGRDEAGVAPGNSPS